MRELTSHRANECNEAIRIKVLDDPSHGGACHKYVMYVPHDEFNEELNASLCCHISFQDGPIKECGTNGFTHEALLAILIDRLDCFQDGPFACRENDAALTFLESAMMWLKKRTEARFARGVEGTHVV